MTAEPDIIPEEPAPAHFEIAKTAARVLGAIADGNGMTADQLRVGKHETVVQRLAGDIFVDIDPDLTHSELKGRQPRGQVVGSKANVIADAKTVAQKLITLPHVHKEVIETLHKRPARGWGEEGYKFKLHEKGQDYSVIDRCNTCNGQGHAPCNICHGDALMTCPNCRGNGAIVADDGSRRNCTTCNGARQVRCTHCNGEGHIGCTACDRSGYTTHFYHVSWQAKAAFVFERQGLPPEALKAVDALGVVALALDGHAEIFREAAVVNDHKLAVPFIAFLPLSAVEFTVGGKNWPAFVAGLRGYVLEIDPFLDPVVKPGIAALQKLSKGPMAAAALMETACKYRLLRSVLSGLAHHSRKWVYLKITKEYPLVLSDKYARASIKYASTALMSLSNGPRRNGLIVGTILSAGVAAFWFAGGGRVAIAPIMAQQGLSQHMVGADLAVYILCLALSVLTIKLVAAAKLKKLLPESLQVKDHGLPPAGNMGAWAILTVAAVFLAAAVVSTPKPEWIVPFTSMAQVK